MSASKAKGTAWESAIVQYLRGNGVPHAERRALAGNSDRGDIAGIPGLVIEAKSAARVTLAEWLDEAEAERINDNAGLGVVWFKRRGKTSPGAGFVLMDGDALVAVLRAAGYIASDALTLPVPTATPSTYVVGEMAAISCANPSDLRGARDALLADMRAMATRIEAIWGPESCRRPLPEPEGGWAQHDAAAVRDMDEPRPDENLGAAA